MTSSTKLPAHSSRSPSPDFSGAWPQSNYRPYPADTTIPLSLLPKADIPMEERERVKAVRVFKGSQKRPYSLRVDVLEHRFKVDVRDYLDGCPLVADEVRETRRLIPKRERVTNIRPIWKERARALGQYFKKVELKHADLVVDQLLSGSGGCTETPATATGSIDETNAKKRKRGDSDDEEEKEKVVKRQSVASPVAAPVVRSGTVKIPGLFLLDG